MNKTVIVLGLACSGTSIVAGILHCLGIEMNPADNPLLGYPYGSFEDEELQEITNLLTNERVRIRKDIKKKDVIKSLKDLINTRTDKSPLWGFKSALTYRCLDDLMAFIKNPHFVVVFRNILANAMSYMRMQAKNYGQTIDIDEAIKTISDETFLLTSSIVKYNTVPRIYLEHEKIELNYMKIVIDLANFIGIKAGFCQMEKILRLYVRKESRNEQKGLSHLFTPKSVQA